MPQSLTGYIRKVELPEDDIEGPAHNGGPLPNCAIHGVRRGD